MLKKIVLLLFVFCLGVNPVVATTQTALENVAFKKSYQFVTLEPKDYYTDPENTKLTDGKKGFDWTCLVGWDGARLPIDIDLDLGEVRFDVISASAHALISAGASVGLPEQIDVFISLDGKDYRYLGQGIKFPTKITDNKMFEYKVEFEPLPLRYIRFRITPNPNVGWCMLSELEVKKADTICYNPNSPSDFITPPQIIYLSGDVAKLAWSTLEDTLCRYSLQKSEIQKDPILYTLETNKNHLLCLTDLEPNTNYTLEVHTANTSRTVCFKTEKLSFERGPILTLTDSNQIQISFESNALVEALLEYWPAGNQDEIMSSKFETKRHSEAVHYSLLLNGLNEGVYSYRIKLQDKDKFVTSRRYEFRYSDPKKAEEFTFLVYGDTQHAGSQSQVTKEMQKVKDVNFVLHVGDLVNQPGNVLDWEALFRYSGPLMARTLFFPTLGNHEDHHYRYYTYFDLPGCKDYYAINYGPLLLISLDTSEGLNLDPSQLAWLEEELKNSEQKLKIIFTHYPLFRSMGEISQPEASLLDKLLAKYGVTAVFSGHAHVYDHLQKGSVHYFISGGGGGYQIAKSQSPFNAPLHFLKVEVKKDSLVVQAIKPGGEVVDTCVIDL